MFNEAVRKLMVWAMLPRSSNIRVEKILSEKVDDEEKIIPLSKAFGMEISSIRRLVDKEIEGIKEIDKKNKEIREKNQHLKIIWNKY